MHVQKCTLLRALRKPNAQVHCRHAALRHAFLGRLRSAEDDQRLDRVVLSEICTVTSFLRYIQLRLRGLRLPDLAKETLELHNLLEHVALLLEELESLLSEYVVLQAVGASTKTTLVMVSLDDHLDHGALDVDQIDGIYAPGLRAQGEDARAHSVSWHGVGVPGARFEC